MMGKSDRVMRALLVIGACAVCSVGGSAVAAEAVRPPAGAAAPTEGSGVGTAAALQNPRCRTGDQYGVYGRFDSTVVGGGPICVKPRKQGADNGGATAPGVTRTAITVVAVVPNEQQINSPGGTAPVNRTDNSR